MLLTSGLHIRLFEQPTLDLNRYDSTSFAPT